MARPTKTGLDYFPFDVDFFSDPKMQFIRAKHGPRGVLAVVQLYCKIYREGFYLVWNEDNSVLFSKYETGIPKNEVNQIISECLSRDIFNKNLFDQHGILTSNGIQKRYFEASKKRKFIKGDLTYLLIKLNDYGLSNEVFLEKTPQYLELMREIGKGGNKTIETIEINETIEKGNIDISESEKTDSFSENIKNEFQYLADYIKDYLPNVLKMERQISILEYNCLRNELKISNNQMIEILLRMENYKPLLQKNNSVFLTLTAWHKKEINQGGAQTESKTARTLREMEELTMAKVAQTRKQEVLEAKMKLY